MTQEEELKIGVVGTRKAHMVQKKRVGEGNLCNLNQWWILITEQDNLCYCILTLHTSSATMWRGTCIKIIYKLKMF